MPLLYPLVLAAALFGIGLYGVLARRNAVLMLLGVELMLNAVNLNLVAFDAWFADVLHTGQVLTLFTITLAAAEIGLGLAIILALFRATGTADVDRPVASRPEANRPPLGLTFLQTRRARRRKNVRPSGADVDAVGGDT